MADTAPDLIHSKDLHRMLGCSPRQMWRYVARPDFPRPVLHWPRLGRVWQVEDVKAWLEKVRK